MTMLSPRRSPPASIRWCRHDTPLGTMVLAATDLGLCGAWFEGQRHFSGPQAHWVLAPEDAVLESARTQFTEWFEGKRIRFDLPLAPQGTAFQQQVWTALQTLGHAHTTGYGQLADLIGRPKAARAVGAATGRNPCSIVIPCHRLVAADGALTGYAGGLDRKRALLAFEQGQPWP